LLFAVQYELTLALQRGGDMHIKNGGDTSSVVSGVELSGDSVCAVVDGQRLQANWCMHR
jgi:hypothetical protein